MDLGAVELEAMKCQGRKEAGAGSSQTAGALAIQRRKTQQNSGKFGQYKEGFSSRDESHGFSRLKLFLFHYNFHYD